MEKKNRQYLFFFEIEVFLLFAGGCFFGFGHSSAFFQRLIKYIQYLPVGAAEFIRSPFFYSVHYISIDTQHKAFIFCFLCQNTNRILKVIKIQELLLM